MNMAVNGHESVKALSVFFFIIYLWASSKEWSMHFVRQVHTYIT